MQVWVGKAIMQANTFVTVTACSHHLVEDSLLPPFVSGIIYYIIHIVSTFNLLTKAAYTIKSQYYSSKGHAILLYLAQFNLTP